MKISKKEIILKILLTFFLIIIAFSCYYLPKSYDITKTLCNEPKIEIKQSIDGIAVFLRYIGLFCLVLSVWIWRDLLKINQFAFFGSKEPTPSNPDDVNKGLIINFEPPYIQKQTNSEAFKQNKLQEQKNAIIKIMGDNPANISNVSLLSNKLALTKEEIEQILFELQKDSIIRKDIFPGTLKANYSLKNSWLNKAIDRFIKSIITSEERLLSDIRYFKIQGKYDLDAIIETIYYTYVVEVKSINRYIDSKVIERGIKQLLEIEQSFKTVKPLKLVLIFVLHKDFDLDITDLKNEFDDVKDNLELLFYINE